MIFLFDHLTSCIRTVNPQRSGFSSLIGVCSFLFYVWCAHRPLSFSVLYFAYTAYSLLDWYNEADELEVVVMCSNRRLNDNAYNKRRKSKNDEVVVAICM